VTSQEWIRKRLRERAELRGKSRVVADGIDDLWRNLWSAVKTLLETYVTAYQYEAVDWSAYAPEIVSATVREGALTAIGDSPTPIRRGERKLIWKLDRTKATVEATYQNCGATPQRTFTIGVNSAGQATFQNANSEPITVEDVAQTMVDSLLFPDLMGNAP